MSTKTNDMSLADALVLEGLIVSRGGRDVLRDVSLTVPRAGACPRGGHRARGAPCAPEPVGL